MTEDINQQVTPNDRLQIMFQRLKQCSKVQRTENSEPEPLLPNGLRKVYLNPLTEYIAELVETAFIAGSLSVDGIGLNLSREERAAQYLKLKGLRT